MSHHNYGVFSPELILPILEDTAEYRDTKDPCPVFDGKLWHLYGTGGSSEVEEWSILHATAPQVEGPWEMQKPANLKGVEGVHVAAPGVIYADDMYHMFVQTEFMEVAGCLEHLVSSDGETFEKVSTALCPIRGTNEAGIYDVHPAKIAGKPYLTYAGFSDDKDCKLYLAESATGKWEGPWRRSSVLLSYDQVPFHNQPGETNYEWGLEGPQLIELPDGSVLLNAVCFLKDKPEGRRQRVFFAHAPSLDAPFEVLGPAIEPTAIGWQSGENGHAAGVIVGDELKLFFQARAKKQDPNRAWRYGLATIPLLGSRAMQDEVLPVASENLVLTAAVA